MTLKHFWFSTVLSISPFFNVFLLNFADIAKDPIIRKIILFEQIPETTEDSNYIGSTVYQKVIH